MYLGKYPPLVFEELPGRKDYDWRREAIDHFAMELVKKLHPEGFLSSGGRKKVQQEAARKRAGFVGMRG